MKINETLKRNLMMTLMRRRWLTLMSLSMTLMHYYDTHHCTGRGGGSCQVKFVVVNFPWILCG